MSRADAVKLDTKQEAEELGKVPLVVLPERLIEEGLVAVPVTALPGATPPAVPPSCFAEREPAPRPAQAAAPPPGPAAAPVAAADSGTRNDPVAPVTEGDVVRYRTTGETDGTAARPPVPPAAPAPPIPPIPPRVLDDACRGLRGLGYERSEALQRVSNAWRALQERGRRFGMSALMGLALGFRACLEGESPT